MMSAMKEEINLTKLISLNPIAPCCQSSWCLHAKGDVFSAGGA